MGLHAQGPQGQSISWWQAAHWCRGAATTWQLSKAGDCVPMLLATTLGRHIPCFKARSKTATSGSDMATGPGSSSPMHSLQRLLVTTRFNQLVNQQVRHTMLFGV